MNFKFDNMFFEKLFITFSNIVVSQVFSRVLESWQSNDIHFYIKTPQHSHWIDFPYPKKHNLGLTYPNYPFSRKSSQYFCLDDSGAFEDPVFDITLTNKTKTNILITGVGIKIIKSFYFDYPMGGYDATKTENKERYIIKIPDLLKEYKEIMNQRKVQLYEQSTNNFGKRIVKFNRSIFNKIADPYFLPTGGFFRFSLLLKNYESNLCNHNIIQFYIQTEQKKIMSKTIELATLPRP